MTATTQNMSQVNDHLSRLEKTVMAFIKLLADETKAVQAVDLKTFSTLQTTKDHLFGLYQADIKGLIGHKESLRTLPDTTKEKIRALENNLSEARHQNLSALERAGKSFGRLRDRIVYVAREAAQRQGTSYGANGQFANRQNRIISTGIHDRA